MKIRQLRADTVKYLEDRALTAKWEKARRFFEVDMRRHSLKTELLEPRWRGIYSFRIDKKYRALFFITDGQAEVFAITNHYKK